MDTAYDLMQVYWAERKSIVDMQDNESMMIAATYS
jgi:hypothetical protein